MSNVIKSTDQGANRHGVSFNLDDIADKANDFLAKVKIEAGNIVREARAEAERAREEMEKARAEAEKQSHEEGHRQGYREGRAAAEAEVRQEFRKAVEEEAARQLAGQVDTLLPALREAVAHVVNARHSWLAHWEHAAMHVSRAIAERVVRREIEMDRSIPAELLREALELAAGSSKLQIRLSPDDHAALQPIAESLVQELCGMAETEIIADPAVTPGGCRVETPMGVIDQQIESQLTRMEEELL